MFKRQKGAMSLAEETNEFTSRVERLAERMERHLSRLRALEESLDSYLEGLAHHDEPDTQSESGSESDESTIDMRAIGIRFADEDEVVINQHGWQDINFDSEDEDDDRTVAMTFTPFDYYQDGEYDSDASTVVPCYREPWHSPYDD